MKKFTKHFIGILKHIIADLKIPYSNFVHWNIMKILLFIYTIAITIMALVPFIISAFIFVYLSPISWGEALNGAMGGTMGLETVSHILAYPVNASFGLLILLVILTVGILSFSYYKILLNKLNVKYLKGEKLPYFSKKYFSLSKFFKYIQVSMWAGLYLLMPIGVFLVLFAIIVLSTGSVAELESMVSNQNSLFMILTATSLFVTAVAFFYLMYRMYFAFILLVDTKYTKTERKAHDYIKKSIKITTGWRSLLHFLLLVILIVIAFIPVNLFSTYVEVAKTNITNYRIYNTLPEENKEAYLAGNPNYYENLSLNYGVYNDEQLAYKMKIYNMYIVLFNIVFFFAIFGLKEMFYVSFYKRELLGK